MEQPWRTVHSPEGVSYALSGLLWGALAPLILLSPIVFGNANDSAFRFGAAAALVVFLVWRAARTVNVSVATYPDCLVVKNVYRTVTIPWSEVEGIYGKGEAVDMPIEALPQHRAVLDDEGDVLLLGEIEIRYSGWRSVTARCVTTDALAALVASFRAADLPSHRSA